MNTYQVTIVGDDHEILHETDITAESPCDAETNVLDSFISCLECYVKEIPYGD